VYATVDDLRAEGVTAAQATDERLTALIEEAGSTIDRITGWFFEPRSLTLRLDGRGTPSLEPPVPPIALDRLALDTTELSLDPADLVVVGAPVAPGFDAPRISLTRGRTFPKGTANVTAEGLWGFTEPDGTPEGRTPLEIRRACMLLVLRSLPLLANDDSSGEARSRWRIIEERTRDQSYRLDPDSRTASFTGDPEADSILARFRRPCGLGAA
jgi:hypothetical protein